MKTILAALLTLVFCAACENKYQDDPTRKGLPSKEPSPEQVGIPDKAKSGH